MAGDRVGSGWISVLQGTHCPLDRDPPPRETNDPRLLEEVERRVREGSGPGILPERPPGHRGRVLGRAARGRELRVQRVAPPLRTVLQRSPN